jgi:hypothetical protein
MSSLCVGLATEGCLRYSRRPSGRAFAGSYTAEATLITQSPGNRLCKPLALFMNNRQRRDDRHSERQVGASKSLGTNDPIHFQETRCSPSRCSTILSRPLLYHIGLYRIFCRLLGCALINYPPMQSTVETLPMLSDSQ